jgi:hypothetical protein
MFEQVQPQPGSHCQTSGHAWRVTSMKGRFHCHICRAVAYCPDCMRTTPLGAALVRCAWHEQHQKRGDVAK